MPDDTDINSIFKTDLPSPNAITSDDDGDFIGGPQVIPAEESTPEAKSDSPQQDDKAEVNTGEEKPKEEKPSKLDRLKLKKPSDEEKKVEGKTEEPKKKPTQEENIRILRQAKEELDKLKPEYEKYRTDLETKDKELLTTKEELAKLKALGLNDQERQEYQKYRDLHAVEAVRNSEDFRNHIEAPIKAKVDWISTIADRANLDETTKAALYNAVDIPDKLDRQKAIREIFKNADLDIDDFQTYTGEVIAASNELNEVLYPKMDDTLAKAQEIELAAREKEKNQAEQLSAKEKEEFTKERDSLVDQFTKEQFRTLIEDTDLNIDGVTLADAMRTAEASSDPKERAWQAIAGQAIPFIVSWAQKLLNENHQLKTANNIRNKVAPSLGRDGVTKTPDQKSEISVEEAFGRR